MSRYDRYDERETDYYRRPRRREYDDREVDITRTRYDGPAPSRRGGETIMKERETDTVMTQGRRTERGTRAPDFLREDYGRSTAGPLVVREEKREEDEYVNRAPTRRRSLESVRSRPPPALSTVRGGAERVEEKTEIRIRDDDSGGRSQRREYREDDVEEIRFRRSAGGSRPSPPRTEFKEEITIRERERSRPPPSRVVDEEEIRIRERRVSPPRDRDVRKEEIDIDIRDRRRPPPAREEIRNEEIDINIRDRSAPPPRSRGHMVARDTEEWVVRRRRPSPSPSPSPPPRDFEKEEIIIRRKERTPSPEPEPPREPTPEPVIPAPGPIVRPPIIQEVITHYRNIDHGFERARSPSPPPPVPMPPPEPVREKEDDLEIEIKRKGVRNGKAYEEDIVIENERKSRDVRDVSRRRSLSASTRREEPLPLVQRRYDADDEIAAEADYYNRRVASRGYAGEAYNGATKDWALVDVPPGTERVRMDGVGGGRQEITWERYNGERRGKFYTGDRLYEGEYGNGGPPERERQEVTETRTRIIEETTHGKSKSKDRMWTEITKDLVIKEAIDERGYEYEETDAYFYVMEYLRYEDVLRLVEVTEDIRRERRERLREIQREREEMERYRPPKMLLPPAPIAPPPPVIPPPPFVGRGGRSEYDESVHEREVYVDRRRYR